MTGVQKLKSVWDGPLLSLLLLFLAGFAFVAGYTFFLLGVSVFVAVRYAELLLRIWNRRLDLESDIPNPRIIMDMIVSPVIPLSILLTTFTIVGAKIQEFWVAFGIVGGIFIVCGFATPLLPIYLQTYVNKYISRSVSVPDNPRVVKVNEEPNLGHTINSNTMYSIYNSDDDAVVLEVPISNSELVGRVYPDLTSCIQDLYTGNEDTTNSRNAHIGGDEKLTVDHQNKRLFRVDTSGVFGTRVTVGGDLKESVKPHIGQLLLSDKDCFIDEATIVTHTI